MDELAKKFIDIGTKNLVVGLKRTEAEYFMNTNSETPSVIFLSMVINLSMFVIDAIVKNHKGTDEDRRNLIADIVRNIEDRMFKPYLNINDDKSHETIETNTTTASEDSGA